MSDMSVTSF